MAAIGRILQLAGWLWFVAAIFAPALELNLPEISIFPAIVLIFAGRALRGQARRRGGDADHSSPPDFQSEEEEEERPLNTERQPTPPPVRIERSPPREDRSAEVTEHNEMLERILASRGVEDAESTDASAQLPTGETGLDPKYPKSSAELVAEARKRWDRSD